MSFEIILVTNKPFEDVAALVFNLRAAEPGVRVTATCQEGNPAHNRNYGLDQATADVVIQIDDDIRDFESGFASELAETLLSNERYAMVSARLLDEHGETFMAGGVPNIAAGVGISVLQFLPTACVAFHRTAQRFDERFLCLEDQEYCRQLTSDNSDALFVVNYNVAVRHLNNESWRKGDAWKVAVELFTDKWGYVPL